MSIVLIGARGCGKSTIGRRLADRLWQSFVDIDEQIVRRAGKTIRDIFEQDGEERFRDLESEIIRDVAKLPGQVIALGGGSLLREENRRVLKEVGHKLLYLRCDPIELARRVKADPSSGITRPHLTQYQGGVKEVELLLAQREPIYRECMTAELDVTRLTPDEAVLHLVRMM